MENVSSIGPIDYRSGTFYALATAVLVSFQEPFSALAARSLSSLDFMAFTQLALLFSIPLLILRVDSRRDFAAIVFGVRNWPKFCVIFLVGAAGLISVPFAFFTCFIVGFCGAMMIAWSQIDVDNKVLARDVIESFIHSKWIYALPMPAFFALNNVIRGSPSQADE